MEKKDYQNLMNKYSFLADYEERYRKELQDFIHEAFDKHGNEFEYKCDTHPTWQAKNEDEEDEFNAMNDLPVYLNIGFDDEGLHEVYPYRVRRCVTTDFGHETIEVDGWDWDYSEWVENMNVYSHNDDLQAVADFINAVLEQEAEAK